MKNKKEFTKEYLASRVDFLALNKEYKNSWLVSKPNSWLYGNGIVSKYFNYKLLKEAIGKAGYKYPESERTWNTILDIQKELINEYVF